MNVRAAESISCSSEKFADFLDGRVAVLSVQCFPCEQVYFDDLLTILLSFCYEAQWSRQLDHQAVSSSKMSLNGTVEKRLQKKHADLAEHNFEPRGPTLRLMTAG